MTGVNFTGYDMLVDEKCIFHVKVDNQVIYRCTDFVYAFAVMIALHCFQCYLFQKNRSNYDIILTAVPRDPWFPESATESSLVNVQNKKRHVIILFLKSIKTGQTSKNNVLLRIILI